MALQSLQELQLQVEQEASSAKLERKKRETAERLCRQAVEDKVMRLLFLSGLGVTKVFRHSNQMSRLALEGLPSRRDICYMSSEAKTMPVLSCFFKAYEKNV